MSKLDLQNWLNKIYNLTAINFKFRAVDYPELNIEPQNSKYIGQISFENNDGNIVSFSKSKTEAFKTILTSNRPVLISTFEHLGIYKIEIWMCNENIEQTKGSIIKKALRMLDKIQFLNERNRYESTFSMTNNNLHNKYQYLNAIPSGVIICNTQGNIKFFNNAVKHMFNENISDYLNAKHWQFELYDKNERKIEMPDYPIHYISKNHIPIENDIFAIKINNASLMWIKLSGYPVFDANQNLFEIIFNIEEITNEKKEKHELVEALNFLEKTQKIALLGNFTVNLKEQCWYGNDMLFNILGIDDTGIKHCNEWFAMISDDNKTSFTKQLQSELQSNRTEHNFCFKIIHQKTKTARWIRSSAKIFKDIDGTPETITGVMQDITDLKNAEELSIENEKKYKQILENVIDVYYKVDWDLNIIDISPSIRHFTPINANNIIGQNLSKFIDIATIRTIFQNEILSKTKFKDYQLCVKTHLNTQLNLSISAALSFDDEGRPAYIEGFVRDISERLEMESLIRVNEEKFKSYIHFSPVAILVTNKNGEIIESNHALLRLTGYFPSEICLNSNCEMIEPSSLPTFCKHSEKIDKFGYATDEITIIIKGGEMKRVRVESVQIPNGQYLSYITDISYHYKMEEKLRTEQEYLEAAQKIAQVGNAFIDFEKASWEGSNTLKEIVGIEQNQNNSIETWVNIIHPDCFEDIKSYFLNDVIINKKDLDIDLKIIRQNDKQTRWIHAVGKMKYDADGNIRSLRFTLQDITDRKQTEEELLLSKSQIREYAELIQSIREEEKIALAREIHDDLGQMLVALKINLGLFKAKLSKQLYQLSPTDIDSEMAKLLDYTSKTIDTTRKIMTDLRSENIKSLGFVLSAKNYIHNFNERFKIECIFNNKTKKVQLGQKQTIALYRILQESLNNVVKHANATKIIVSLKQTKTAILLQISDDGIGFDTNYSVKSNSYGLRGMNERIALLGGKIEIKSKKNKGTCVCVEIPRE